MFDQHDGRAEFIIDVEDVAAHVLLFFDVHAGHWLVEQQQRRIHRQRAAKVDALLQAVRQLADRRFADVLDFQEVDDLFDFHAMRDFFAPRRAPVQGLQQQVRLHLQVTASHDVVEYRHALEQRNVLERARNAGLGGGMRIHVAPVFAAIRDLALLRAIHAIDHVEHRAFAGAVRANDGADLMFAHIEGNIGQGFHAAKRQRDLVQVEDDFADLAL